MKSDPGTVEYGDVSPLTPPLCPASVLAELSDMAQKPVSALSTMVITSETRTPYISILDYAALSENPLVCDEANVRQHGRNTLFISPLDPTEPIDQLSDDDEDDNGSDMFPAAMRRAFRRRSFSARIMDKIARKSNSRPVHLPRSSFGMSSTAVAWPPPKDLEAERLFQERQAALTGKDYKTVGECDGVHEEPFTVFVSHYTVGSPLVDSYQRMPMFALAVAVVGSSERLRSFVRDVTEWKSVKDRRPEGENRYSLFRLKSTDCEAYWELEGMRRSRPPSSVVLREGEMESIMDDVRRFLSKPAVMWYRCHGLPHRRSFLFHGPPGTGKTSTIRAIASTFQLSCCFLSLTNSKFSNQKLADGLSKLPKKALLVLEDVDALFNKDRESTSESLTFSGLLNALDGVLSVDHVITVMTTNHIERLDKALIRGGRVDRRFFFDHPRRTEIETLFGRFYPDSGSELRKEFAEKVLARDEEEALSVATLQQLFIMYRENSAEECVKLVDEFFETHFPDIKQLNELAKEYDGKAENMESHDTGKAKLAGLAHLLKDVVPPKVSP